MMCHSNTSESDLMKLIEKLPFLKIVMKANTDL